MKRREFITKSIASVSAAAAGASFASAAVNTTEKHDPYEQDVALGKTGMKVSRMCLGTGMRGWDQESNHTRMGKEKFHALIRYAYEKGIRVFDLADLYGTHPYIIPALKSVPRKNYKIVSKIWFRPRGLKTEERPNADIVVQRFLKEMKTDYIDLLLIHCQTDKNWNTQMSEQMEIMDKLKKKGIIRAHGISCHSMDALKTAVNEEWVDSVHARINAFGVKMDDQSPKVVAAVLKQLHDKGKGVVGMKLIGEGQFREDSEKKNKSIDFVSNLGCVDVFNVGFEKPAEIDDFITRLENTPKRKTV